MNEYQINPAYNWISMVDGLSGEDITKHDDIYKTNLMYCLDILSYRQEKYKKMEIESKWK
jgi:hypothetical protein